ncbi:MAG: AcrR family transcriptional regulator [Candidatus Azotimanducaceae bacterium]|jgi:AcrR family transcriptional regulator
MPSATETPVAQRDPELPWWPVARPLNGSLNLGSIASAAIELIDEGGESHLTMRRIADRLGSSPMAVYWHVTNREELLAVARDSAMAPVRVAVETSVGWRGTLESLGRSIHLEIAVRHPHLVPLALSGDRLPGPNLLAVLDQVLVVLFDAGFSDSEAASALRMVVNTSLAFRSDVDGTSLRLAATDVPAYPGLTRLMNQQQWSSTTERFEIALAVMIAGIEGTIDNALVGT